MNTEAIPSTRPYLIRALYEWCVDSGFTPYVAVAADETVRVPVEHVKDGEIVLNISMDATSALKLGNEYIEFKARFGGVAREIVVPVERVLASRLASPKSVTRGWSKESMSTFDGLRSRCSVPCSCA